MQRLIRDKRIRVKNEKKLNHKRACTPKNCLTLTMRTLGKLTRRFPRGVIINSHPEQFVTRTGSDMQVQIPLAKTALRSPIQTGKGTILGGTSLDALSRARKQTRRK